ncbi:MULTISPECIES: 5-oxoprolinase subunit B family protein [Micromonospora]|uniref:5-oxoprolinase subunit B family protein n=1 Tax=Micromonospora TaxID=1873 RepID=UPI001B35C8A8|nr:MULTISPECIES: allophanate hydrolase subunit 1 [unclassified Micromonospora]MBQ0978616.1 allophanate hydrolase subunit 1 [Micromonospora sp. M61]MBQ1036158.1 allophanate hydrolase subunit 1 [Micromonospora sp. C81]WTI20225.1 allophanate hydrolase subunit 1 [Micromonospora zamorensis]
MRIRPVGAHALLLDCTDPDGVPEADLVDAWRAELWRRREQGDLAAVEIVPAASTVLLDGLPDPAATAAQLTRWAPAIVTAATARRGTDEHDDGTETVVPVDFDGPDLPAVAEHWGVDVPAVLSRLTGTRFRVAFCGFAPGFPYLTGLPAELALPRLATPRPRVPPGSVALAGPYAGIYPGASPGGWQLVGRTDLVLFDVHADPPARLGPGTPVRMAAA